MRVRGGGDSEGAGVGWPVTLNGEAEEILLFLSLFFFFTQNVVSQSPLLHRP